LGRPRGGRAQRPLRAVGSGNDPFAVRKAVVASPDVGAVDEPQPGPLRQLCGPAGPGPGNRTLLTLYFLILPDCGLCKAWPRWGWHYRRLHLSGRTATHRRCEGFSESLQAFLAGEPATAQSDGLEADAAAVECPSAL